MLEDRLFLRIGTFEVSQVQVVKLIFNFQWKSNILFELLLLLQLFLRNLKQSLEMPILPIGNLQEHTLILDISKFEQLLYYWLALPDLSCPPIEQRLVIRGIQLEGRDQRVVDH